MVTIDARTTDSQSEYAGTSSPLPHLSPQDQLEARFKLLQALQVSQEPQELLVLFFTHLQNIVGVRGMHYIFSNNTTVKLGRLTTHRCDYRLTLADGYLGQIIFSRSKRFTEDELALIENLLGCLVYPLRNASRYQEAIALALQDSLTGLGNRIALDKTLHQEFHLAERYDQNLSLLMIDIDHFKLINDTHGHSRGDQVLREVAARIQSVCRESDLSFRYGGEEFVVVLRNTNASGASIIAERLRQEIAKLRFGKNNEISTTVSIGVGSRGQGRENMEAVFEEADQALYEAKAKGRNRIVNLEAAS